MTVETASYINALVATNPSAADPKSEGDDHLRLIKAALKASFPNIAGPMPVAHDQVASKTDIANAQFSTALPSQSGNAGKVLSTDGTNASWQPGLPTQTSNAGKFLTTDGTSSAWGSALKASVVRFADGTDATKLAAFDLSGLTTGTTRSYAMPNKNGTVALLSDIPPGTLVLLGQATVGASVANIDFTNLFSSAYDRYVIDVSHLMPSVPDTLSMRLCVAGIPQADFAYQTGNTGINMPGAIGSFSIDGNGQQFNYLMTLANVNSSSFEKVLVADGVYYNTNAPASWVGSARRGVYTTASVISGIRFFFSGGANFTAGTVRVYGIKNS